MTLGDQASPQQPDTLRDSDPEAEYPVSATADQGVLEPSAAAVVEGRPRGKLVYVLARTSTYPRAVHEACEVLGSTIEGTFTREFQRFEKAFSARFDALLSEIAVIRRMMGVLIALIIAILVLGVWILMFVASK